MAIDRERRQSIADHDADSTCRDIQRSQLRAFMRIEYPAEIGPLQIGDAILRAAAGLRDGPSLSAQRNFQLGHIERRMNGIARHRVRPAEAQNFVGRHAGAGAAERYPRRRHTTPLGPNTLCDWRAFCDRRAVGDNFVYHATSDLSSLMPPSSVLGEGGRNRPSASVICMRCSHSSNSGARFRPNVSRRKRASWNDVLW